jgi:small-conductance mechanosensitive channel
VKPPIIVHPAPVVVVPVVAVPVHHTHTDDVSGWDVLGIILVFAVLLAVGWWAVDRWYR